MMTDPQRRKAALRAEMRTTMHGLSVEKRDQSAAALCARFRQSDIWKSANAILLFAPLATEPDLWPLVGEALAEQKIIGLPRFATARGVYVAAQVRELATDIVCGKFQIREPGATCPELVLTAFDLVLVPGVAFDPRGRRLGRGRGYYDRLLSEVRGVKCGVAFEEQVVGEVPAEPHDTGVDCVVTPTRWIKVKS